ncbi:MAG: proline--tRNA ligase [Candidatus Nealsonbacteria bacterium]
MLQSKLFAKIQKLPPKEAKAVSHKFLVRGDFIDQSSAGVYNFLPLGWRVYKKIERIIRKEMINIGGEELYLRTLISKKLWSETGRWKTIDPPLFVVKDRHGSEFGLGSTHEEMITDVVRKRVNSYKDLPLYLFQIQEKFRNEMRPTGGLLRVKEFLMKDLYSFHVSEKDAVDYYQKVKKAYFKIFKKCGLKVVCAEADSGTIGGSLSNEFMVFSETGEDKILICKKCKYAANIEKAGDIKNCPKCKGILEKKNCIESGHAFFLGTKYSKTMRAFFVDEDGKKQLIIMGCYGIGLGRLMATIVEANHDEKGIIWPDSVSPFSVHLLPLAEGNVRKESDKIYKDLQKEGIDVLYDDRMGKTPGEKFAEADLIGIPLRIVVSEKTLKQNSVELKRRSEAGFKILKISKLKNYVR